MTVRPDEMLTWCNRLLGNDPGNPPQPLNHYLSAIPRLADLADLPSGTTVLVRGDLDAKPGPFIGEGDIRLQSMVGTLTFGRQLGWRQVLIGHVGRDPEKSLTKIAKRLGELMEVEIPLVPDWLDPATNTITQEAAAAVRAMKPGSLLMLENARKYKIERALWSAGQGDLPALAEPLAKVANQFAQRIAAVYVNEALSAGSLDTSSTVLPAAMDRVALGQYVASEFDGPMQRCLGAKLVVFSGLKTDKLDDLQAIIDRGCVEMIFAAGSLSMALRKAAANLDGKPFCIGRAGDPDQAGQPYYISPERVAQAERMLKTARAKMMECVLPVDFVRQDGSAVEALEPDDLQFDIGPKTSSYFEQQVGRFIERHRGRGGEPVAAFHNGVFGKFEEAAFEEGTRHWVGQLRRLKESGIEVYVGGGEGGEAIQKYGQADWVTHIFTAGGTILNALGSQPVPYLVALYMAARQ